MAVTKQDVINYVMNTPHNTNKAVLSSMLNQLIDGGDSGSSDFSTAEVTVINQTGIPLSFIGCLALEDEGEYASNISETVMSEDVFSVIMYKGRAYCEADGKFSNATTTGNVSYNDGTITVTGNGTITITT